MPTNKPGLGPPFLEKMFEYIKKTAIHRFHSMSGANDFKYSDETLHPGFLGHWLGLILVSGPHCRIVFKCFFSADDAKQVASKVYGLPPDSITLKQAQDFIREFCNLTAGGLVKILRNQGVNVGISLPIVVRGFDDIFYDVSSEEIKVYEDFWKTTDGARSLVFSSMVEIFDEDTLSKVDFSKPEAPEDDVEFL